MSLAIAFTGILFLPLSISFIELVRQNRLESSLRTALLNRTVTFQRLDLVNINTDWLSQPPQVNLTVRAKAPITPKQVKLLESFLEREMGQKFTLVFLVSRVEEVTQSAGMGPSSPSPTGANQ